MRYLENGNDAPPGSGRGTGSRVTTSTRRASCLRQQFLPHLLAQRSRGVKLLVAELLPAPHAGSCDLAEPLRTIPRRIALGPRAENSPASVDRLQPTHHFSEIPGDGQLTARQLHHAPRDRPAGETSDATVRRAFRHLCSYSRCLLSYIHSGEDYTPRVLHCAASAGHTPGSPGTFFKGDVKAPG